MTSTGITRRVDDLGRVIIPKEIRRSLWINYGDPLEISVADGIVCFRRVVEGQSYIDLIKGIITTINEGDIASRDKLTGVKQKLNDAIKLLIEETGTDEVLV